MDFRTLFFTTLFVILGLSAASAQDSGDIWAKAVQEIESARTPAGTIEIKAEVSPKSLPISYNVKTAVFNESEMLLAEQDVVMTDLKKEIEINFVIIEDILAERFESVGISFTYYDEVKGDNKLDHNDWIVQQENILKDYRKNQILSEQNNID